mmetsp:Transcript_9828/g.16156  ORF Transcript_9828/g.16156 Transcript_9828/m.16156 type:complete len:332 (+) Transcript_9828:373-1368(+)
MEIIFEYATAFFHPMKLVLLEPIAIDDEKMGARINPRTGKLQLSVPAVFEHLLPHLPRDAVSLMSLTMEDLFFGDDPDWTYGQENLSKRVGIFSFARYDSLFYNMKTGVNYTSQITKRVCKVTVHEMAHMLVLKHCTHFHCAMNGANTLNEMDRRPCHMCPVCLRKTMHVIKGKPMEHFRHLLRFYKKHSEHFAEEMQWVERRIDSASASGSNPDMSRLAVSTPSAGSDASSPKRPTGRHFVSAGVVRPVTPNAARATVVKKVEQQPRYAQPLNKKNVTSLVPKNLRAIIDKAKANNGDGGGNDEDAFSDAGGSDEEDEEFAIRPQSAVSA